MARVAAILVLVMGLSAAAAEPGAPDLYCPFDGQTAAILPTGTRAASSKTPAVFAKGVSGQAITVGSADGKSNRSTHYPVADLLDAQAGSVSFWVAPLDWRGGDAPFHVMLRTMAGATYFMVYKFFNSNTLLFLLGPQERWTSARTAIPDWGPGQWHHVACTWSDAELTLWVDGQRRASERLRYPIPPFGNLEPLSVGPGTWGDGSAGTSLIDEVRLYRRVISPREIEGLYLQCAGPAGISHETGLITVGIATPILDGAVGAAEYAFAGTGFMRSGGILAQHQSRYFLSYDDQRLYLAVTSPLAALPPAAAPTRDADLADAERVELHLSPTAARQPLYRFAFTPDGRIADARDDDLGWDCARLEARQQTANGTWTAEVGIPFAALGLGSAPHDRAWRINVGRVFLAPPEVSGISPTVGGLDDWSHFYTLRFRRGAPAVRIGSLFDVTGRVFQADIAAKASGDSTITGCFYSSTGRAYGDRTTPFTLFAGGNETPYVTPRYPLTAAASYRLALDEKTAAAAQPLYRGSYGFDPGQPLKVLYVYTLQESRQLLLAAQGRGEGRVRVRFLNRDGAVVLERFQPVPAGARFFNARFDLDFAILTPGDYRLRVDHIADDGTATGDFAQEYRVPKPDDPLFAPYVDVDANQVPAPWTPLRSDVDAAQMWGRRYDLAAGFLVSGLESKGQPLLAAPARLCLDGKELTLVAPPVLRQIAGSEMRAEWEKSTDLGVLQVRSRLTVHFDGYCEISMTLGPAVAEPLRVQTLALEFPFRGDIVRLVRDSFVSYGGKSGAVGDTWCQTLADLPMLWVGNEEVGFNWVASDLSQWHYRQAQRNVEIRREGELAVLRFNLVDTPLTLDSPRTIDFGFVVTPSRPLDPRLRRYRTDKEWQMWCQPWRYFNYIDAEQMDGWRVDADSKGHDETFLYMGHGFVSPFCPEWAYWEEDWRHTRRAYGEFTGNPYAPVSSRDFACYAEACLKSDGFRNFHLHQMDAFFRRAPVRPGTRNTYFDFSFGVGCDNAHHGCTPWLDLNGKPHGRVQNSLTREVTLATYRMIKRADPQAKISSHLGYPRDLPVQHFSEILVAGEGMEPEIATRGSYYDLLTPELFRATYLPQVWGMKVVLINQLVRSLDLNRQEKSAAYSLDDPEARRALLHLLGYMMVHDVEGWWANLSRYRAAIEALWATQDRLGWDEEVVFHPYWQPDSGVARLKPNSSRVMASAYSRRGKLLLAVLNDTDQAQDVGLRLDLDRLGVTAGATGQAVWQPEAAYELAGSWEDTVGPRGFRLILWEPTASGAAPKAPEH